MYRVYKIVNDLNSKVYIGITKQTLNMRFKSHLNDRRKHKTTSALYNAMELYPDAGWAIKLVEDNIPETEIDIKEQYYIKQYNSYNNGYNCTLGGRCWYGNHPSIKKDVYTFINKHTGIKESLTMYEFYTKYNYNQDTVHNFIIGKTIEMKDWLLEGRKQKPYNNKRKQRNDLIIYTLYHDNYECFIGTLPEFKNIHGDVSGSDISQLRKGKRKNLNGWRTTKEKYVKEKLYK